MELPDNYKIKRALISVSDKTGIVAFAKVLAELGIEIYSTGGTAKLLMNEGIAVKFVSDLTKFPEIMDGRVKTLHPAVHAGLLAVLDDGEHIKQMNEHSIQSIDLLIVNLYPFEQTLRKANVSHDEIIENIDVGGPAMLRAAAKNYRWTVTVVNSSNYDTIAGMLKSSGCIPEEYRKKLAGEAFTHTAYYDSVIADYFDASSEMPEKFSIPMSIDQTLRYGENPHQKAALYGSFNKIFTKLHGKELSYNNILDIDAAAKLIIEFDQPTVGIIKHTNPCGVGKAQTLSEAFNKAFETDKVSPFGGIFVMNRTVDLETANTMHGIFSEVIIAHEYTHDALELLMKKKDRRLIKADYDVLKYFLKWDIKAVAGGYLMQDTNVKLTDESTMKTVTKRQPTDEEIAAMMFGWRVVKHVKSNAIVYAKADRTLGIGAGQMSRVDSSKIAVDKAKEMGLDLSGSTVASDAFFPFADGLLKAVEAGATAVIQPGGSVRDEEVIQAADENNIAMIFTGIRHFRH